MHSHSPLQLLTRSSIIVGIALLVASQAASAGPPEVNTGGPGGEATSLMIEQLGLVSTHGGADNTATGQVPVLVGSGPERETVARPDTFIALSPNTRSILMTESKNTPGGVLAGGEQPAASTGVATLSEATASYEDILASAGDAAAAEQAPQATLPNQITF